MKNLEISRDVLKIEATTTRKIVTGNFLEAFEIAAIVHNLRCIGGVHRGLLRSTSEMVMIDMICRERNRTHVYLCGMTDVILSPARCFSAVCIRLCIRYYGNILN